jgi:SET domain
MEIARTWLHYCLGFATYRCKNQRHSGSPADQLFHLSGYRVYRPSDSFVALDPDKLDVQIAIIYACDMETRSAKLDVFVINGRKGLFAVGSIAEGEILIDLNEEETLSSPTRRSLQIGEGKHAFGGEETVGFLNHGCEPNVFLDFSCLCVRALKYIRAGEEVKINYAATEYEMHDSFQCNCGSPVCLRIIRGFKFLTRDQQLNLKPYLAPYLLRRLDGEE